MPFSILLARMDNIVSKVILAIPSMNIGCFHHFNKIWKIVPSSVIAVYIVNKNGHWDFLLLMGNNRIDQFLKELFYLSYLSIVIEMWNDILQNNHVCIRNHELICDSIHVSKLRFSYCCCFVIAYNIVNPFPALVYVNSKIRNSFRSCFFMAITFQCH